MAQKTRAEAPKIEVGNRIEFTNLVGYKTELVVARVEEKSWYVLNPISGSHHRNSYGSLVIYSRFPGFKIL